jgi:hypothetical protein
MGRFIGSGKSTGARLGTVLGSVRGLLPVSKRLSNSLMEDAESEGASLDQLPTPGATYGMTEETISVFEPAPYQNFPGDFPLSIEGVDIASVISDTMDITFQTPTRNWPRAIVAETHLATLLAENSDISLLCEELLAKIPRERFVQNFRRLLGSYYLALAKIANSGLEKATMLVLREDDARERVSRSIAERFTPSTQEGQHGVAKQDRDALDRSRYLEEWIQSSLELVVRIDEQAKTPDLDATQHDSISALSNSDSEDDEDLVSDLPNLKLVEDFLTKSVAFEALLASLQIFALPSSLSSLTRLLMTIPNGSISFVQNYNPSSRDRWKEYIEYVTGGPWKWWPLPPSKPKLATGDTRVNWKCVSPFLSPARDLCRLIFQSIALWDESVERCASSRGGSVPVSTPAERKLSKNKPLVPSFTEAQDIPQRLPPSASSIIYSTSTVCSLIGERIRLKNSTIGVIELVPSSERAKLIANK